MKMKTLLETFKRNLNEARDLSRILQTLLGNVERINTLGIMTAQNPDAQPLPAVENAQRNKNLENTLRQMNLGFRHIRGKFGTSEDSYIIPNISFDELVELGQRYGQQSVIYGKKESGRTSGPYEHPVGPESRMVFYLVEDDQISQTRDVVLFGPDVQDREDFYSQEPRGGDEGRKFLIPFFDSDFQVVDDDTDEPTLYEGGNKKIDKLIEQIDERVNRIFVEGKTKKYYWENRGMIKEYKNRILKELRS